MNTSFSKKLQKTLIVFPAIAMVVSVGCASVSGAKSDVSAVAKKTTTTVKKKGNATWPTALSELAKIKVAADIQTQTKDKRSYFKHWIDEDKNGCDTRSEVFKSESLSIPQVDVVQCVVVEGDWLSPYDAIRHTNISEMQIDHMVPLAEAWNSGAATWSAAKREKFANDLKDSRPLIAVTASLNASKKDRDPAAWMPPNVSYHCTYLSNWIAIKVRWGLTMDLREKNFIKKRLTTSCKTATVAPWGSKQVTPTSTVPPKGSAGNPTALAVLASIPQAKEQGAGYNRNDYKHWSDLDGNGCSTREDVLIAESRTKPQVDAYGCKVIAGDWYSPYDNKTYTYPADVDIDHVVALKEAHDSGAWAWSAAQREKYANDLSDGRHLIAVKDSENQSKSDKDPSNWIPKNPAYLCTYLADWVAIKAHWKLSMDTSEWGRIKNLLTASCKTTTITPWGSKSSTGTSSSSAGSSSVAPVTTLTTMAPQTTAAPVSGGLRTVTPGAYCAPEGERGTYNGKSYLCATTNSSGVPYSNGRARWRQG